MYIPPAFETVDLKWLDWLVDHDAFGTLVSQIDGAPFASHLPILYRRESAEIVIAGHWARSNPQWLGIESQRVLFMLHGPHSYISPLWYSDPRKQVPTWNYAVAHLYGQVRVIEELREIERIVDALATVFERRNAVPWTLEGVSDTAKDRIKYIVGFEFRPDTVQLKLKLNQGHNAQDIAGVINGLQEIASDDSTTVAKLMSIENKGKLESIR